MKFKAMKFRIGNDQALSKRVQKILFELGYKWSSGLTKPAFLDRPFLYAEADGCIIVGEDELDFLDDKNREIDISWMRTPRNIVEFGGKKYYEDEVLEAISKIKEVEE